MQGASESKDYSVRVGITECFSQFPPDTAPTFNFSIVVNTVRCLTCESSSRRYLLWIWSTSFSFRWFPDSRRKIRTKIRCCI